MEEYFISDIKKRLKKQGKDVIYDQHMSYFDSFINVSLFTTSFSSLVMFTKKDFIYDGLIDINTREKLVGVLLLLSIITGFISILLGFNLKATSLYYGREYHDLFIVKVPIMKDMAAIFAWNSFGTQVMAAMFCFGGYYGTVIEIISYCLFVILFTLILYQVNIMFKNSRCDIDIIK